MEGDNKDRWFVLYTKNKQERIVREEIPFNTIVPMIEQRKSKSIGGKKIVYIELQPKYPNYVFVQHDGSHSFFDTCLSNKNVVSFASGEMPYPISLEEERHIFANELTRKIEVDSDVFIIDGPYKGQIGTITAKTETGFTVKIKVFNLEIEENIPQEFLSIKEE